MFERSVSTETDLWKPGLIKAFIPLLRRVSLPLCPFPPLWNIVAKLYSDHPTHVCLCPWPLRRIRCQLTSNVAERSAQRRPRTPFISLIYQFFWRKSAIQIVNLCDTSVFHRFQPKTSSQRRSWASPTHLWFINWWFITQRHIGNANVSTFILFSPDERHGGTAVQGLLGFVNSVAAAVEVGFPV